MHDVSKQDETSTTMRRTMGETKHHDEMTTMIQFDEVSIEIKLPRYKPANDTKKRPKQDENHWLCKTLSVISNSRTHHFLSR